MQKRVRILSLLLGLLLLTLTGCRAPLSPDAAEKAYVFQDDENRTVHAPVTPKRVAVLFSSLADMWRLAGGTVAVTVGESVTRGIVPVGTPLVDEGAGKNVAVESLLSEKPDFVIGSADIAAHKALAPILEEANIPFALFRVDTFADYERVMASLCRITEREDLHTTYVAAQRTEIDNLLAVAEEGHGARPLVLFVRVGSGYSATKAKRTDEHFVCAMLGELGAENLADSTPALSEGLNIEAILKMDPDYIFFSTMGKEESARAYMDGLLATAPWQALTAVKQENYTYLPKELFQYKPCERWAEAYGILYGLLYPVVEK